MNRKGVVVVVGIVLGVDHGSLLWLLCTIHIAVVVVGFKDVLLILGIVIAQSGGCCSGGCSHIVEDCPQGVGRRRFDDGQRHGGMFQEISHQGRVVLADVGEIDVNLGGVLDARIPSTVHFQEAVAVDVALMATAQSVVACVRYNNNNNYYY